MGLKYEIHIRGGREPLELDWPDSLPDPIVGDGIAFPTGAGGSGAGILSVVERTIRLDPEPPHVVLVVEPG